jgi:hypothetical protein
MKVERFWRFVLDFQDISRSATGRDRRSACSVVAEGFIRSSVLMIEIEMRQVEARLKKNL